MSCGSPEHGAARLLSSSSPYLREHADNPVNWYPWGDEAFDKARKENKPVIVSIGYMACHWCHVMERESFMDPEVAKIMNENFISIKVDREERPDVDQQFVYASQALTGTAGWPLNAFALNDGKPFHTITYHTKPEWIDLLNRVSDAWKADSEKLIRQANSLTQGIRPLFEYKADTSLRLDLPAFVRHIPSVYSSLDFNNGGLKGYPKFPMPALIELMLQHHHLTGDQQAGRWVATTLDAIASGGIYDHVGGGFARYSTDSLWHVPHFEKMLYDNAQLLSVYSKAYKATGNARYERVVSETLEFLEQEMMSDQFLFFSSIDADSDNEEGKFYKWTLDELRSVVGEASMRHFRVSNENILTVNTDTGIDSLKTMLRAARGRRIYPLRDEKVITSWNAMLTVGILDAATALGDDKILRMAYSLLDNLNAKMSRDQGHKLSADFRVFHSMLDSSLSPVEGYLDDYAWLAKANIRMYEVALHSHYLERAKTIADMGLTRFQNHDGPLFYYSATPDARLMRTTELFDQATPSSNSVFADVLLRLGEYYQDDRYTKAAQAAITEATSSLEVDAASIANWSRLAEMIHSEPFEIAIVGDQAPASNANMELQANYLPTAMFLGGEQEDLPLLENKRVAGKTIIYVCRNRTCKLPVTDPEDALKQILYR